MTTLFHVIRLSTSWASRYLLFYTTSEWCYKSCSIWFTLHTETSTPSEIPIARVIVELNAILLNFLIQSSQPFMVSHAWSGYSYTSLLFISTQNSLHSLYHFILNQSCYKVLCFPHWNHTHYHHSDYPSSASITCLYSAESIHGSWECMNIFQIILIRFNKSIKYFINKVSRHITLK